MAILSLIFYILTIGLFVLFNLSTIARLAMDPGSFFRFLRNPSYSFFFSCYPIGATTLIVVSIDVVYGYYGIGGKTFLYFLWVMWWMNVAISALCLWGTTHWMCVHYLPSRTFILKPTPCCRITRHSHNLSGMTAAWILPIATFTVASSTGALTSQAIHEFSVHWALITATVSAYLVSTGLVLGSMIFTVYLLRLVVHGFPQGLSILSAFAPVGVSIQAGLAVSLIGAEFHDLLPLVSSDSLFFAMRSSGDAILSFSGVAAFTFWTWAVMWIVYGLLGVVHTFRREKFKFKLSAWGLVFPNVSPISISASELHL
jgi:tellurite resistance protein TehA-like permease